MYRAFLYLIAGWSGFFVMGLELLGGRLLAPYFGSSIYVWGAIITVFMLALSLGYLAGGRASLWAPSLRRLATLLLLAALGTLPVLLFSLPAFVSGMISPYAVRLLVADRDSSGHHAGKLYFVSTFGSAAGTVLTSFYLVLYLEVNQIVLLMLGVSVALGLMVCMLPLGTEA